MRTHLRLVMTNILALIPTALLSAVASAAAGAQPSVAPFVAHDLSQKVHLLSTPPDYSGVAFGNVTVIEQREGFVLIDGGMTAAHGRTIVAYVRSLSAKPIKAVAITHWHNDHHQGISAIRDAFPSVRIISTRATEQFLLSPDAAFDVGYSPNPAADAAIAARFGETVEQYRALLMDSSMNAARRERIKKAIAEIDGYIHAFPGTYIVAPTETFERELVLADREVPVRLMFLGRANTAGDLVAWMPAQKMVVAGDIVVSPYPFGYGSYPGDWMKTLSALKALGFTTLIPGHGEPQHDASYLDKLIRAISDIRAQTAPLAKRGLSIEEAKKQVNLTTTAALFGSGPGSTANFQSLFGEPMTVNAFQEALGRPMIIREESSRPRFTERAPASRAIHHTS